MELWQHQIDTIEECKDRNFYALFWQMGTGKTCGIINILRRKFIQEQRFLKTLILTPLSVVNQFAKEWAKFGGPQYQRLVLPMLGTTKQRKINLLKNHKGNICITNHDVMNVADILEALWREKFEVIVVDESHKFKDAKANRTKKLLALVEGKLLGEKTVLRNGRRVKVKQILGAHDPIKYRFIMTGTPILNSVMDIYPQSKILNDKIFPEANYYIFRNKYMENTNALKSWATFPKFVEKAGSNEYISKTIYKHANRVLKEDCLDLPPLVKIRKEVELGKEQGRLYKEMEKQFIAYLEEYSKDKAMVAEIVLTKGLRLLQILCGVFVDDDADKTVSVIKDNQRIKVLEDTLEEIGSNQAIIWTSFKSVYTQIEALLKRMDIPYSNIIGGQNISERQEGIEKFQDGEVRVMLANQAAGGTGINLTAANYMIYYNRTYSLADDLQSEARNYRGGSEIHDKVTRIDLFSPGTIDETIMEALHNKMDIAKAVVDRYKK